MSDDLLLPVGRLGRLWCALRGHRQRYQAFVRPVDVVTDHGPALARGRYRCRCGSNEGNVVAEWPS